MPTDITVKWTFHSEDGNSDEKNVKSNYSIICSKQIRSASLKEQMCCQSNKDWMQESSISHHQACNQSYK